MALYDTWFYQNILNTEWLIWIIIYIIFGFNILSPIFIFFILSEKKMKFNIKKWLKNIKNKSQTTGS